ncbi:NADH-plastoquinone oxidoreductase subunit 7 [Tanacetum coccineum]|uniref:NADH-plastoquinone oxidoreductase subunit 7 n=1 Tax=Tanacetum coccineum TaxID=301880 RepID=A0ABQ4XN19_9ASTR
MRSTAPSVPLKFFAIGVLVGLVFLLGLLALAIVAVCASRAATMPLAINCWMAAKVMAASRGYSMIHNDGDGDSDAYDDNRDDDEREISWYLRNNKDIAITSLIGTKKYQGSNSKDGGNTGDGVKIAGGVIESYSEIVARRTLMARKERFGNEQMMKVVSSGWSFVSVILGQMTYPVASPTLDTAWSYVMQGAPFTQGTIPSIPIDGNISPEGFLPSILLLVVIIVTVVVVIVILIVVVVDDVSLILKLSFVIIGVLVGPVFLLGLLALAIVAACAFRAEEMPSVISCWMAAKVMAGVSDVDFVDFEPVDDILKILLICLVELGSLNALFNIGNSVQSLACYLLPFFQCGEKRVLLRTKKYRGSNSSDGGNTGDGVKIAGGVIGSGDGIELKEMLPDVSWEKPMKTRSIVRIFHIGKSILNILGGLKWEGGGGWEKNEVARRTLMARKRNVVIVKVLTLFSITMALIPISIHGRMNQEKPMTVPATRKDLMIVNMGPHHPSMHGVLRLIVTLDGEDVIDCEPILGYLHREAITVNAPEQLGNIQVPKRASYIRVIMLELSRIASHLLWLGPFMADIGAQTPFFYIFRDLQMYLN